MTKQKEALGQILIGRITCSVLVVRWLLLYLQWSLVKFDILSIHMARWNYVVWGWHVRVLVRGISVIACTN